MLWSILIAAIPSRYHSAHKLLFSLLEQQSVARMPDVELLYFMDNRRRSVGAKRNALLSMAMGDYISFIDDDDAVAPNYVGMLHEAIVRARKDSVDVICFGQKATLKPAGVIHMCTYSLAHYKQREPDKRRVLATTKEQNTLAWTGPPSHTMVWRRETVKDIKFPDKQFGEDVGWVDLACEKATTEIIMDGDPLYYYQFDENKTATR